MNTYIINETGNQQRILKSSEELFSTVSYFDKKLYAICVIVGLMNSFFYSNWLLMLITCVIEGISLFYMFFKNRLIDYLGLYIVYLSFSLESGVYAGTDQFYGFKNFRILGLNLAVYLLFPLLIKLISNTYILTKNRFVVHSKFVNRILLFSVVISIAGIISYIANDNGIKDCFGGFKVLINNFYSMLLPALEILIVSWVILDNVDDIYKLKRYIFALLPSMATIFILCLALKNYGNRGGLDSLQISEAAMLIVFSLAFLAYGTFIKMDKVIILGSSCIIIFLSLLFNSSGKLIIAVVLLPVLMVYVVCKRKNKKKLLNLCFCGFILLVIAIFIVLPYLSKNSQIFTVKLEQALKLLSFSGEEWLNNMPASPKMRITEFLNVGNEISEKPWTLVFGKGIGGTYKDNLALFDVLDEFAFSEWELQNGLFFGVHESLNLFFLTGGLFGLIIFFDIAIRVFKNIWKSPWLIYGFIWFILFYNYHMTIGFLGIVSMCLGLIELEENEVFIL